MTDKPVESGNQEGGSSEATPSPEFQSPDNVQQTSQTPSSDNLRSTVEQVLKDMGLTDLDQRIERTIQSTKDRRFSQLNEIGGRVDELEANVTRFRELTSKGMSDEDALWRMRTEQFMQSQQQQATPGQTNQPQFGKPRDWWVTAQSELLKSAGVPENDPAVAEFARSKKFNSPEAYLSELAGFVGQRLSGNQTSGALNMSGGNATPPAGANLARLKQQYQEERAKIPRGSSLEYSNLRAKYRQLGYDPATDEAVS